MGIEMGDPWPLTDGESWFARISHLTELTLSFTPGTGHCVAIRVATLSALSTAGM